MADPVVYVARLPRGARHLATVEVDGWGFEIYARGGVYYVKVPFGGNPLYDLVMKIRAASPEIAAWLAMREVGIG